MCCKKKMYIFLLLISISILPLNSQAMVTKNSEDSAEFDLVKKKNAIEDKRIELVNNLQKQNNYAKIDSLFKEDEEAYFELLNSNDAAYANFVREMMYKAYRTIPDLQDDLLFIDCKKAASTQDWDLASLKANDLIRRYPDSNRKKAAIRLWKVALIKSGKDQEFIQLVEQFPEFELASQSFQYGQSLYNVGRFDEAQKYLTDSAIDDNYALRATASLGLVAFAKGNIEEAAIIFDYLESNYTVKEPYYDFVILSKARLFSHYGDSPNAIKYYQAYNKLNASGINDVTYEIAVTHRKSGDLSKAKRYFELILGSKYAADYYVPTLYNLVMIDQELNEGKEVDGLVTNYQARVDDYFESLLVNRTLINEVRTLRDNYLMENQKSRKDILLEQIRSKEQQVLVNQVVLDEKISFLDVRSIHLIKELELRFLETTESYFIELEQIEKYRNSPKTELVNVVERERSATEESYLLDITEELVKDIENLNDDQFIRAYWYANQIYLKRKYIVNVSNLVDKTNHLPEQNAKLRGMLDAEIKVVDDIKVMAKFDLAEFPNLAEKQALVDQKIEEFLAKEKKLEVQRNMVIDTYYEKVADKKERVVAEKFIQLDQGIQAYSTAFSKFTNIKNSQNTYIEYVSLDLEFRKLNESYKQRRKQAEIDSISISEAEINQMVILRENLYNRTNNFTFKNNQFENNYKLHFNLGELATFVYPTNHNLIYNHYKTALQLNPNFAQKDAILYNLAYYKNQMIDNEIADIKDELMKDINYFVNDKPIMIIKNVDKYAEVIGYYLELMKDMDSEYQIEAMFRLAKLYFDIAVDSDNTTLYVEKAIKVYQQVYLIGNQNQKFEALFQGAWHKMSIGRHTEAINDIEILMTQKSEFSEEQTNRYENGGDIIAYSLNYMDGVDDAEYTSSQFVSEVLFTKFDEETANSIFAKLIYRKQIFDSYKDIVSLYNVRSLVNPNAITNPTYTDSILVTLGTYSVEIGDSLNAWGEREYRNAYAKYGYNSAWYAYNKDNDIAPYVKSVQKGLDDFIIPGLYKKMSAQATLQNISEFSRIVDEYSKYKGFNEEIRATKLSLYDSNAINTLTKYVIENPDTTSYRIGIEEVYKYLDRNPNSKDRKDLEQNAYSWALNTTVITDSVSFDTLRYSPEEGQKVIDKARREYLEVADRFYNYLATSNYPDKDNTIHSLLYYRGIRKVQTGDNEGARQDFLACDSLNISNEFKEGIYRNLADIYKGKGDYDTSTEYFAKAKTFAKKEDFQGYEIEIYSNRSAKVTQLNSSEKKEDKIKAAQEMEIILQSSVVDDKAKAKIKRDAIALYAAGGDYDTAIARLISEGDKSQEIDLAWDNYGSAISIADSLGNNNKTVEIENRFMERFPTDKQTFIILAKRLAVVADSTSAVYNPNLASEKYKEIYDRASQTGKKLDISGGNLELDDYYYNSIEMKCRNLSKADQAVEWVSFRNKFPQYKTVPILNLICKLYEESGQNEKYLEYIKILYAIDKTNSLYPVYAIEELTTVDKKISKSFRKKDWKSMLSEIAAYKKIADKFKADGIPAEDIAVPQSLERYALYTTEYEREQEKKELLAALDKNFNQFMKFISVSPNDDSRVKVNTATSWGGNLSGKDGRISKLDNLTKQQFELIEKDIAKVLASELLSPKERREQIFLLDYAKFKISKYVGETIYNQIDKYLTMTNGQYVAYENQVLGRTDITYDEQDEILFQYESNIATARSEYFQKYAVITIQYARDMYNLYINGFTTQLPRSEEVMAFLEVNKVEEAKPKDEITIPFTQSMRKDYSNITDNFFNDGNRDFIMYNIPGGESLLIETDINCPIFPIASRFRFLEEGKFWHDDAIKMTVKFNDNPIDIKGMALTDGEIDDSLSVYPYLSRTLYNNDNNYTNNFLKGKNKISISIANNSYQEINVGMIFSMIYDQEKLYIHNNSTFVAVVSNNSWLGADAVTGIEITKADWKPVNYGSLDVDYSKLEAFQNSGAIPIWMNDETATVETKVDTSLAIAENTVAEVIENTPVVKYFTKEFDLSGKVIECTINFLANETANIYLNGQQVAFEEFYFFAPPDSPEVDIDPEYFVSGKNVLIIEVNSPSQNNGLLVDMKIRTLNQRR